MLSNKIVIIRPEVQQIVEVLGKLKGAADWSDSTDSEEDSQREADIEDQRSEVIGRPARGMFPPSLSYNLRVFQQGS